MCVEILCMLVGVSGMGLLHEFGGKGELFCLLDQWLVVGSQEKEAITPSLGGYGGS